MTAFFLFVGALVLLDVLALAFGADSRHLDKGANAWW